LISFIIFMARRLHKCARPHHELLQVQYTLAVLDPPWRCLSGVGQSEPADMTPPKHVWLASMLSAAMVSLVTLGFGCCIFSDSTTCSIKEKSFKGTTSLHLSCASAPPNCCRTFLVGEVDSGTKTLVTATKEALNAAIDICRPDVDFREIGKVIQTFTTTKYPQLSVGKDFIGHGVGKSFHAAPWVFHFLNNEREGVMKVCSTLSYHFDSV
jgi:hypothetical protein